MNNDNILSEGFFDKLASLLGLGSSETRKLKKDQNFMSTLKSLNKNVDKLDKEMRRLGSKKSLRKFTISDFTK
tara:strand:- start:214 stop:432 length:219 start_codon:yes stop_codon:yes gene_type:complete